jgi:enoyl-CoA hydratase/carnithine racemase
MTSAMSEEVIVCSVEDGIATVTMNRPEKRNAMNVAMLEGFVAAFERLDADRDVRVVVIRGEGVSFCAGLDLRDLSARQGSNGDPESGVTAVLQRIEASRHPTIAMVHGDALAGGCELALHCDLRVAAEPARLGMPLARIGLVVPYPLGRKLVEVIGPAHTRQLLLTGQPINARRAHAIGMVHEVVPAAEIEQATYALARTIAANAPLSLAGMKQVVARAVSAQAAIAHEDLDALANRARFSHDAREGVAAMLEKRTPNFLGE